MGWFKKAMEDFASRKGARKLKTTVVRKTEDGSITVTVKGVVATDVLDAVVKAVSDGITMSGKGGTFGAAEGSQAGQLVDEDAGEFLENVCDPKSYSDEEKKPKKRSTKADTVEPSLPPLAPSTNGATA